MLTLKMLTRIVPVEETGGNMNVEITGIHYDSRQVKPGYLFVCIKGFNTDGHRYIGDAKINGATAALVETTEHVPEGMSWVRVTDTRKALATVAADFYGKPSERLRVVGVTGTNGKTTTTHLIESILQQSGKNVGLLGTITNRIKGKAFPASRTTPESLDLQRFLSMMVEEGVEYAVMEVSSHALDLERVRQCYFDAAVFTNLTQDHLDYHMDLDDYMRAKGRLFASLGSGPKTGPIYAVINVDDPYRDYFINQTRVPVITYGLSTTAQVRACNVKVKPEGAQFTVKYEGGNFSLTLRLTGMFSVYNALAACAVALREGVSPDIIVKALENVRGVPGRFESVDCGQNFTVIVDYAHTPDSLENVLRTAREVTKGRIITVFGCGGDRDRLKRPLMGEVAGKFSDYCIVTSDNPRSEEPEQIIAEIEPGIKRTNCAAYQVVADRRQAIETALNLAQPGDLLLIAGKGHETYQEIQGQVFPFDDRQVVREILGRNGGKCNAD